MPCSGFRSSTAESLGSGLLAVAGPAPVTAAEAMEGSRLLVTAGLLMLLAAAFVDWAARVDEGHRLSASAAVLVLVALGGCEAAEVCAVTAGQPGGWEEEPEFHDEKEKEEAMEEVVEEESSEADEEEEEGTAVRLALPDLASFVAAPAPAPAGADKVEAGTALSTVGAAVRFAMADSTDRVSFAAAPAPAGAAACASSGEARCHTLAMSSIFSFHSARTVLRVSTGVPSWEEAVWLPATVLLSQLLDKGAGSNGLK